MEDLHHECGVAGIMDLTGKRNVVPLAVQLARELEHRGGLAAGIAVPQDGGFRVVKENGTVADVLSASALDGMQSPVAMVHLRYATAGSRSAALAQPLQHQSIFAQERFAFGWNGTLANAPELRERERKRGTTLRTTGDSELLKFELLRGLQRHAWQGLARVFAGIERHADGAFNVVLLSSEGTMAAYANKGRMHPLSYAHTDDGLWLVGSENVALENTISGCKTHSVGAGQLLVACRDDVTLTQVCSPDPHRCFFEWTYFSRPESVIDGAGVGDSREVSGRILARLDTISPIQSFVVAVPDSARRAAAAFADEKDRPLLEEGIINLLPGQRTFTADDPARTQKAQKKYGISSTLLRGRSIILVDDSMVRGTTMRELVRRIREEGGASQIHLRLACPPILSPCFYGIDFPEIKELLVRHFHAGTLSSGTLPPDVLQALAEYLGVDSIQFLPVEAVPIAIGCESRSLCMACVTGRYPTRCGQKRATEAERKWQGEKVRSTVALRMSPSAETAGCPGQVTPLRGR